MTDKTNPIAHAVCLLRKAAQELQQGHTLGATPNDWTGEPEAKAAYDEHMGAAAALEASAGSEPVATVFTMEALTPGGGVKYHATIHKPLPAGTKLYTHPSPPEGMVGGWQDIATAPAAGLILLAVEDSEGERRVFPAEASHQHGCVVWMVTVGWLGWTRLHSAWTPILWRRLTPPPTTSAGSGKG